MSVRRDWYDALAPYFAHGGTMARREPIMARAWHQQGLAPAE